MDTPKDNEKQIIDVKKEYSIIINARQKQWFENEISFEQVITHSFGIYQSNDSTVYTVTYSRGDDKKPNGMMVPGDSIKVKDKMVFNVTATNKS
jgi:hypothetical protein